ncbi:MAG: hypothetical protein IPP99_02315 [Chitinophagaceae bacterium]|nr:hypothetical protein [Chitinophagaceae bacterium]
MPGDAVLSALIADYLFKRYPYREEGFLTEMRSKMSEPATTERDCHTDGPQKKLRSTIKWTAPESEPDLRKYPGSTCGRDYLDQAIKKQPNGSMNASSSRICSWMTSKIWKSTTRTNYTAGPIKRKIA